MIVFFLLIVSICSLCDQTNAHVSLTYPPARSLALDYIITLGFDLPCGMPKGSIRTTLKQGSLLNVTWHLGFPHRVSLKNQIRKTGVLKKGVLSTGRFPASNSRQPGKVYDEPHRLRRRLQLSET
jgi:hypothetical protein